MTNIADIPDPSCSDTPMGRRSSVQRFIAFVRDGSRPPRWLLERIAAMLAERMDAVAPLPANRPPKERDSLFLAWFAAECDPDFQRLPRTRDGRFAAIGALLSCDETKVQRDASRFARSRKGTDFVLIYILGERYAQLKRLQWPEAAETFLHWYHERPRGRKKSV